MSEALERLIKDACYGISSGDHEIMNPDNYKKEIEQHESDVKTIRGARGALDGKEELERCLEMSGKLNAKLSEELCEALKESD